MHLSSIHFARKAKNEVFPDPHLHTHLVLFNVAIGQDNKCRSVDSRTFYKRHQTIASIYHRTLERELNQLGLKTEPYKNSFRLTDVPLKVCDRFSNRSREVLAEIQRLTERFPNLTKQEVTEKARTSSRGPKGDFSRAELISYWQVEGIRQGFSAEDVLSFKRAEDKARKEQEEAFEKEIGKYALFYQERMARMATKSGQKEQEEGRKRDQEIKQRFAKAIAKTDPEQAENPAPKKTKKLWAFSNPEPEPKPEKKEFKPVKEVIQEKGVYEAAPLPDQFTTTREKLTRITLKHRLEDYAQENPGSLLGRTYEKVQYLRNESRLGKPFRLINSAQEQLTKERQQLLEVKRVLGLIDKKTYLRAKGEYYKPTSKPYHAFLEATGQISHRYRTYLDQQLEVQKLVQTKDSSIFDDVKKRRTTYNEDRQMVAIAIQTDSTIYSNKSPFITEEQLRQEREEIDRNGTRLKDPFPEVTQTLKQQQNSQSRNSDFSL